MSSVVTAVFKATVGLLVNKGRDKAAEKLKDDDVTDQKFRGFIVREIDEIKEKLNGLSRKDLLASVSFFKEGIEFLYEVFKKAEKARSRTDDGTVTAQAACAEAFSLAEGVKNLELTGLDESATRALSNAKKRFKESRKEATRAFQNEALEASDRILAMQYRVMATILETVDNPEDAVAPCRVCIEELNSYSAVQNSFDVQLKKGLGAVRGLFGKDERGKIISNVCHVNRVIYDVTQTVGKDVHLMIWPTIDAGEDKVDPLRDERITEVLRKQGMGHCCVTWSFGQEGEEEHKLKEPWGIATNSKGQFIVGDCGDGNVKVFDSTGSFMNLISLPNDDTDTKLCVIDVATDMNDNIHVLAEMQKPGYERLVCVIYEFNSTADLHFKFTLGGYWDRGRLKVINSVPTNKVFGWASTVYTRTTDDGQVVSFFLEDPDRISLVWYNTGRLLPRFTWDVTAANGGRIIIADGFCSRVHIFSEQGDELKQFELKRCYSSPRIAFHWASEHVVVAGKEQGKDQLQVEIYTIDGEFVRSTQIKDERIGDLINGMTVTTEGRIAVACKGKVLVI